MLAQKHTMKERGGGGGGGRGVAFDKRMRIKLKLNMISFVFKVMLELFSGSCPSS